MRSRSVKIGDTVRDLRVDALIGRGGMGVVYRAWNDRMRRDEALKVITDDLASDAGFRERFLSEARIAVDLEHPHVIPVYDAGEAKGGLFFMSMRYIEDGNTMASLIAQRERLDPGTAAKIISGIASALDHAHGQGLVHRDVKPANILIAEKASHHPYLTDFGLSKRVSSNTLFSGGGSVVGTVDYMSPEQGQGELVDARTDIYALGTALFEALTGKLPYVRDSDVAVLAAKVLEPAPMVTQTASGIPSAFDAVLARALARDPAERYPSAGELGRAAMEAAGRPSTVTTTKEIKVGSVLADCLLEEIAGKGGMAVVYRATQQKLDRTVALKVMAPELADDPDFRVRFEREWKIAAVIDHPNVIPIYWAGESRGRLFIVMRYVEGETLRDALGRRGQLEPGLAVEVIGQLASALDEAHSRGLVHRDIKPGNVLIEEATGRVFLSDFGLAKDIDDGEAAADGRVLGTVRYLPPERGRDEVVNDVLGDIYSLGLVLQEMLGGVARIELDRIEGIPPALARVVDRAVAEEPTARFASAGELARAARQALDPDAAQEEPDQVAPVTVPAAPPGATDRRQPFEPKPLSHGLRERVMEVCDTVLRLVSDDGEARPDLEAVRADLSAPLRLAVIGDAGSGRSTLINAILGRRLTETGSLAGLAPTVTLEHGVPERAVAVGNDGTEHEHGLRPDGTLPEEITGAAAELAALRVRLPLDALRTVSLIHTSLPQADETLAGGDTGDAADAFLVTWPADSLDELARAGADLLARLGGLNASSVNATIVPTKADLASDGAGIDMAEAGLGHAVAASTPVAALLAETAKLDRVTSDDVAILGQLASEFEGDYEGVLSSPDTLLEADISPSREEREEILGRYGLRGIRCALELADADQLNGTDLKRRLRAVSGLAEVDLQIAGFHQRADALKADAALTRLEDLSYRWPDLDFLRDHVEAARLEPEMHLIGLIRAFERCAVDHVDVPDDLVASLERFIKGRTPADRLGLDANPDPDEVRAAAVEGFRTWKMFAEAGSASPAAGRLALVVARSYEIVGREPSGDAQAAE